MMRLYGLVALGGAIGSGARFWLAGAVGRLAGIGFPWGTILINVLGSFVIGWAAARALGMRDHGDAWRAFVITGLCGGFTTFSAFSLQTVDLLREGRLLAASGNVAGSVLLCALATMLGLALGR